MSRFQIATTFSPYTPSASSEYDEHPVGYLTSLRKPHRPWWAADATPTVTADQGADVAVAGVFLDGVNFSETLLETSPDNSIWTAYGILAIPYVTRLPSTSWPRRAGYFALTAVGSRYLRFTPGALDAGHAEHRIGTLALVPSTRTLVRNFNAPIQLGKLEQVTAIGYANDGEEEHSDGRPRLGGTLIGNPWPRPECDADFLALDRLDKGQPFLLHEDNGDASAAYILKKTNDLNRAQFFRYGTFSMDVRGFG